MRLSSTRIRRQAIARLCLAALVALGVLGSLAGCGLVTSPPQVRGNRVDPDALKELVVGTSTRADATALLGSPTARATFDDNTWVYIGEVTQPRIGQVQAVLSQDVTVLTFNDAGVLQGVKRLSEADAQPVDVVSRTTPSPGGEASFMQQLLGNVGRFSAGTPAGNGLSGGGAPRSQ